MKRWAGLALAAACAAAGAAEPPGKAKSKACAACHGALGISVAPDAPHLAGQPRDYLAEQLRAFRSGKRGHPQMNVVARTLSDADIEELAAWYASLQVEARERS